MSGKGKLSSHNFVTRCISAAVIGACLLLFFLLGGYFWFGFFTVIAFIGLWEFYRVFGIQKSALGIAGYVIAAGFFVLLALKKTEIFMPCTIFAFLIFMGVYVLTFEKSDATQALAAFTGFIYLPVLMSCLIRLRLGENGSILTGLVFVSSWGCDTAAYFSGVFLGKHKMAPVLSPKKTWEGAAGGVLGTALLGAVYGLIFKNNLTGPVSPVLSCALIAGAASVVSMIGDLTASAFKRNRGIKDYSSMIPGHGGILDRFDSVIFVAPVILYLTSFLIH